MNETTLANHPEGLVGPADTLASVLSSYRSNSAAFDEAVDDRGNLRSGWQALFEQLSQLSVVELRRRVRQAQRQMDIDGVAFNPHDDSGGASRPWSLDPVPLVIRQQEWAQVAAGLEQRAKLADLMLLDLLGPQTLLRERILPPEVLFAHPRYYPAYHNLVTRPHRHLQLYAADLSRSPDGSWWVTSDRTRSPFGLGYVLENRLISSRMFPVAFGNCNVRRLASFFITLQGTLRNMANRYRENPRIAIWSKGPKSRAYFEDALLARYLGYTLVEGDDLAVRNNRVMIKTLGGLLPVEVLLRRVEDYQCDPTELAGASSVGVSGLLEVVRSGNVSIGNSIGSCLVESPMLLAFLPTICKHLLGEELKLPSVATWWCGQPRELEYVLKHLDRLMIRTAFRSGDEAPFHPSLMSKAERQSLISRIRSEPGMYVGQEVVHRSTAPVWDGTGLKPWSLAMRSFLIAKDDEYEALPGALARVSPDPHVLSHNMTSGEKSQDVWIVSDEPVERVTLLSTGQSEIELKRAGADLPSRAADNLFWLGRNLERAEQIARLVRITLQQLTSEDASIETPRRLMLACQQFKQVQTKTDETEILLNQPRKFAQRLAQGVLNPAKAWSLRSVIQAASDTGMKVRDRIALDSLRVLGELRELFSITLSPGEVAATELVGVLDQAISQLNAMSGLASESMTRTQGWRFLDMGRRIERAFQSAKLIRCMLPLTPEQDSKGHPLDRSQYLEHCLQIHDSFMTYRSRYLANVNATAVLDLLVIDDTNPRSILFQVKTIADHVDRLPRSDTQATMSTEQRIALALLNAVQLSDANELSKADQRGEFTALHKLLARLQEQLPKLSDAISGKFLIHAGLQRHFALQQASPEGNQ